MFVRNKFTTTCQCCETLVENWSGKIVRHVGIGHDCHYVRARTALIPEGEQRTMIRLLKEGVSPVAREFSARWNTVFSEEMDKLAREKGLFR